MQLKNKKIKSFSCVLCAVLIELLTVFSAIGFSPKKEKISASADSAGIYGVEYYLYLPAGTVFTRGNASNSSSTTVFGIGNAGFSTMSYIWVENLSKYVGQYQLSYYMSSLWQKDTFTDFDEIENGKYAMSEIIAFTSDNGETYTLYEDCYVPLITSFIEVIFDALGYTFSVDMPYFDLSVGVNSLLRFYMYRMNGSNYYNCYSFNYYPEQKKCVYRIVRSLKLTEENMQVKYDEGYEAGYEQGEKDFYPYGYADGYSKGLDEGYDYGCEESAGALFDTCEMDIDNLDDNRDNLDNDKLSFRRVNAGTYEQAPLYLLSVDNSENDFKVGTRYEIEIKFSPYVDYSTGSKFPRVDELYISAGKYGDYGSFGDPSERLTNLNSEVYTYGKGNGKEFTCSFGSPSLVVEDNVFGTFKAVKYNDDLNVGDEDNLYMKTLRFNFVYDDTQVAIFTTQNLVNSYLNAYNYTYKIAESAGNANGYKSGYTDGYNTGHTTGYTTGSVEGLQNAELGSFMNLITAVIDAPVKSMLGLLDFEILGMDMQKFFLSLLSAALIIAAYRLFSGGA